MEKKGAAQSQLHKNRLTNTSSDYYDSIYID